MIRSSDLVGVRSRRYLRRILIKRLSTLIPSLKRSFLHYVFPIWFSQKR